MPIFHMYTDNIAASDELTVKPIRSIIYFFFARARAYVVSVIYFDE